MRSEILNIFKEKFIIKISIILISLFPIILLLGSSILNVSIVLMNVLFLILRVYFVSFCVFLSVLMLSITTTISPFGFLFVK